MTGPARFITFEGGEGAGKTTQIARLAERLRDRGAMVTVTREPGGTPEAEAIRGLLVQGEAGRWDPLAETLLHLAARRQHLERLIRPALASGGWVLCDRFLDSTRAYQGAAQGVASGVIEALAQPVMQGLEPGLTLVLDLPPQAGLARAAARGDTGRYERWPLSHHHAIRQAFLDIAAHEPDRCRVVDAEQPPEAVAAVIWQTMQGRFPEVA
jgi:dTMP kinase